MGLWQRVGRRTRCLAPAVCCDRLRCAGRRPDVRPALHRALETAPPAAAASIDRLVPRLRRRRQHRVGVEHRPIHADAFHREPRVGHHRHRAAGAGAAAVDALDEVSRRVRPAQQAACGGDARAPSEWDSRPATASPGNEDAARIGTGGPTRSDRDRSNQRTRFAGVKECQADISSWPRGGHLNLAETGSGGRVV